MTRTVWTRLAVAIPLLATLLVVTVLIVVRDGDTKAVPAPKQPSPVVIEPLTGWITLAGVDIPVSEAHGPFVVKDDGAWVREYSRDEPGAAYAAVNLLMRSNPTMGPVVYERVLRLESVQNADSAAMLAEFNSWYDRMAGTAAAGGPVGSGAATVSGYRVISCSDQTAAVDVLLTAPGYDSDVVTVSFRVNLSWNAGTWLLVVPAHGDWQGATVVVPPSGRGVYTEYGPEGI